MNMEINLLKSFVKINQVCRVYSLNEWRENDYDMKHINPNKVEWVLDCEDTDDIEFAKLDILIKAIGYRMDWIYYHGLAVLYKDENHDDETPYDLM